MRNLLLIIAITVALSGCAGPTRPEEGGAPSAAADPAIAALKDTVGVPDQVRRASRLPREQALAAADDYRKATGKWFNEENGFSLLASYASGDREADSAVGAAMGTIPDGRSVRFQLTSRDASGKRTELIAEYVGDRTDAVDGRLDFSQRLPARPDTNYLLSVEILSPEGLVEDTFLTTLFVPPNELNARLSVQRPAAEEERMTLTVYNAGPTDLMLGYGYLLYRKASDGWRLVPLENAVPAVGIIAGPGYPFTEEVSLPPKLQAGSYRLVKQIEGNQTRLSAQLAADFEVP